MTMQWPPQHLSTNKKYIWQIPETYDRTELNSTELNWTKLNLTELKWIQLNWIEFNLSELNWTEFTWTELNWIERLQIYCRLSTNEKQSSNWQFSETNLLPLEHQRKPVS